MGNMTGTENGVKLNNIGWIIKDLEGTIKTLEDKRDEISGKLRGLRENLNDLKKLEEKLISEISDN